MTTVSRLERIRSTEFAALDGVGPFLNSASVGPMPKRSLEILHAANADRAAPADWPMERLNGILNGARERAARLIGADTDTIALMPNTSTGINVAAHAVGLGEGDVVLGFDGDFPINVYPWLALGEHRGIRHELIPRTERGWPDEARLWERLTEPEVRAVSVSLTQFSNGYTLDLDNLSRECRKAGVALIVDAIQAIGQVPVDVSRTPVDFLAAGAQKWLLSPWGTGFLHVHPRWIKRTYPTFAGWAAFKGTDDYSQLTRYDPEPWPDARRFELITLPVQDFAAMNSAIDLILGIGVERIAAHVGEISEPLEEWAASGGGMITSPTDEHRSAITCIRPHRDVAAAYQRLTDAGVTCSLREGSIRLSPHLFNRMSEVEQVIKLLGR